MSKKLFYLICSVVVLALVGFVQANLLVNGDFEAYLALVPNPGDTDASAPTGWEYDRYYGYDVDPWLMNISAIGDGSGGDVGVVFGTWNVEGAWGPVMATYPETAVEAGQYTLEVTTVSTGGTEEGLLDIQLGWFEDPADPWANYDEYVREWVDVSLFGDGVWATLTWDFEIPADDPGVGMNWYLWLHGESYDDYVIVGDVKLIPPEPGVTIPVDPNSDIATANELAQPGDTIEFAAGTYDITSQIEIKDGVTYKGAGAGLTIIDGNDATRAFVAWGNRGATDGQVDANGVDVPNMTGPTGWVLDGLTIQNCVSDANNRQDILGAARNLLNSYTGTPYTLATAGEQSGAIADNPEAFEALSGGADDDLTDVELQAYLDNNPPGSEGHYVINDDKKDDGGAICILNGASGVVQNCTIMDCNSNDHGGALFVGSSSVDVIDCTLSGLTCKDEGGAAYINNESIAVVQNCTIMNCSADDDGAVLLIGNGSTAMLDECQITDCAVGDDGGVAKVKDAGSSLSLSNSVISNVSADRGGTVAIFSGASSTVANCVIENSSAVDDGGAFYMDGNIDQPSSLSLANCVIDGASTVDDDGAVYKSANSGVAGLSMINCLVMNCVAADDRIIEIKGAFNEILNNTFVNNTCADKAIIGERTDADNPGEHVISNNIFVGNSNEGGGDPFFAQKEPDVQVITITNNLFFENINDDGLDDDKGLVAIGENGNIEGDPMFVGPDDFHLTAGSPAIDASDPATATDADIEGTAAVGVRDVGAYEFVAP